MMVGGYFNIPYRFYNIYQCFYDDFYSTPFNYGIIYEWI